MTVLKLDFKQNFLRFFVTTGLLVVLTILNYFLDKVVDYRALGMIYLIGISTASLYLKNYNIVLATVLGALCWNLLFIPPRFTFAINSSEDWAILFLYLVAGLVIRTFMKRLKGKEEVLRAERNRATQLYTITRAFRRRKIKI